MTTYKTAQIAAMVGVHPNTIRFYEDMKLLPEIPRTKSGYRIFNESHLNQLRLIRTGFRAEIISDKLRSEVYEIIKTAARLEFDVAYQSTYSYSKHLQEEKVRAEEAIQITLDIIDNMALTKEEVWYHGRKKVAEILGISIDVLRDWERNGLLVIPRNQKGHRTYGLREMNRLKIIRTLRNAHYSMMSILRMLNRLDQGEKNIRDVIDTPGEEEDIVCAADRYITALNMAQNDAQEMLEILEHMKNSR